jgi:hypothetical protein
MQVGDGSLTLEDWYKGTKYQLNSVGFADSPVWTKAGVNDTQAAIEGTESSDAIYDFGGNDYCGLPTR